MSKTLTASLSRAVNEKDVENAYRAAVTDVVGPSVAWTSPHQTDGVATWTTAPATVRLLLEAKFQQDLKSRVGACNVLGQMILYLKRFEAAGDAVPNVLLVGDKDECFVLSTDAVRGFLALDIDWSVAPSKGNPDLTRALVQGVNLMPYVYDTTGAFNFRDVIAKVDALAQGVAHQVRATPSNISAIFAYWRDRVFRKGDGKHALTATEQVDVFLRCLFLPTDVALHPTKKGVLIVPGYQDGVLVNADQYASFFSHFVQGYKPAEVEHFYANKDRLVDEDDRRRQGAFFTPALWVAEAHREMDRVLGEGWRRDCVVWDPAAGTANLTRDYTDWGCLISSTAEKADVKVMRENRWGGQVFHYDFLNDDAPSPFFGPDDGDNRIPSAVDRVLREAAKAGKRLVFLANPPYGTAGVLGKDSKEGIATNATNGHMKKAKMGKAASQLYAQFMFRFMQIAQQYGFTRTTVGLFSPLNHMCSGSYARFRQWWYARNAYQGGFMFQASHFADVSGAWGISFTVWSEGTTPLNRDIEIDLRDVADFQVRRIGGKMLAAPDGRGATDWLAESASSPNADAPKFSSGLNLSDAWDGGWRSDAICGFVAKANCPQQQQIVFWLSGPLTDKRTKTSIVCDNRAWRRAVALFGARKLVTGNWINDKDEYLAPDEAAAGYDQWVNDCHIYALLHPSNNCTAMRDVQYKGKSWRIKNNWFWRTRTDTLAATNTVNTGGLYRDARAENEDAYFAKVIDGLALSDDARRVLDLVDTLWLKSLDVREDFAAGHPDLHLMAHDAGVYQLKQLWKALYPTEWEEIRAAHKALADRLRDGVYDYGFLRR
jgi:hypothetical protein